MSAQDDKNLKKPAPALEPKTPKQTSVPVDEDDVEHRRPLEWRLVLRLLTFLGPVKWRMVFNVIIVLALSGVALLGTYAISRIVKYMRLGGDHASDLLFWIGVLAATGIAGWLLDYLRAMGLVQLGQRVLFNLRMTIFRHLQTLSLGYFDRTKQGWIISRASSDLGTLDEILTDTIPQIASALFLIVGGTVWMAFVSPRLFLVLLAAVPLMAVVTFFFHGAMADAWREVRKNVSRLCANLAENIAGVRVVQAFTRERRNLREFDRLNLEYYRARVRATVVNSLYFPSMSLITAMATAAAILFFGLEARASVASGHKEVEVEKIIFALAMLRMFFEPIRQLTTMYGNALGAMASAERIFGLLDTPPEVEDRKDARAMPPVRGDVRFENVTFAYNVRGEAGEPPKPGEPVLHDVSLDVPAGSTVALVGPTGAGKSSIVNLLSRFYDPQAGRITVDGIDLRDVTAHSYRSQMGVVNQDAFLFTGTVMENIKFGRPQATDEEVYAAAKAIGAHDVLLGLRDGYQTTVQERGEGLSGGERQLVCFTRAMVADPRILVLDEATSSVDTATEQRIQFALERLIERRTSFVVAHRLSTVRNAGQVLVVQDGRIVERGTHSQLLFAGGEYARMYKEFLREG